MKLDGSLIKDNEDRTIILRGCNLGGSSKLPYEPTGATWNPDSLRGDPAQTSFIGRPFPLENADEHLDRLAAWGFNIVRFVLCWEAIEHAGPGIYDEAYLAYLRKLLKKTEERGIAVYMDPHQDVWSRWTGGDGAPRWTLEKIGINPEKLFTTGAALTQQEHEGPYPRMIWPSNYSRYAAATMFTLFFAGNTYAPDCTVDGEAVQDWLQRHYLNAMRHCYRRLKDCKSILGWGIMNEPHSGFIGYKDITSIENAVVKKGPIPSAFQGMAAASGHSIRVPVYKTDLGGIRKCGSQIINPKKEQLFMHPYQCPWKQVGVWTDEEGTPQVLKKEYFSHFQGRQVDFNNDFLKPFMIRFIKNMREAKPESVFFIEGVPNAAHPQWTDKDPDRVIHAFHWYDGLSLISKRFTPWFTVDAARMKPAFGRKQVEASFKKQIKRSVQWTEQQMGGIPGLLGEFGLPFDMHNKKAYADGDYSLHEEALGMYYNAIDSLLLHSTIWNYTADNTHEHGDNWNDEDLSIWGAGTARAEAGWRRPYPMATVGRPLDFGWNPKKKQLYLCFEHDPKPDLPTLIYAPEICLGSEPLIALEKDGGTAEFRHRHQDNILQLIIDSGAGVYRLTLSCRQSV